MLNYNKNGKLIKSYPSGFKFTAMHIIATEDGGFAVIRLCDSCYNLTFGCRSVIIDVYGKPGRLETIGHNTGLSSVIGIKQQSDEGFLLIGSDPNKKTYALHADVNLKNCCIDKRVIELQESMNYMPDFQCLPDSSFVVCGNYYKAPGTTNIEHTRTTNGGKYVISAGEPSAVGGVMTRYDKNGKIIFEKVFEGDNGRTILDNLIVTSGRGNCSPEKIL